MHITITTIKTNWKTFKVVFFSQALQILSQLCVNCLRSFAKSSSACLGSAALCIIHNHFQVGEISGSCRGRWDGLHLTLLTECVSYIRHHSWCWRSIHAVLSPCLVADSLCHLPLWTKSIFDVWALKHSKEKMSSKIVLLLNYLDSWAKVCMYMCVHKKCAYQEFWTRMMHLKHVI